MAGEATEKAVTESGDDLEMEIDLGGGEGEHEPAKKEAGKDGDGGDGGGDGGERREERKEPRDRRLSERRDDDEGDETPEERRARRKAEKARDRERRQNFATQDATIIASLTELITKQGEKLNEVTGQLSQLNTEKLTQTRDYWVRAARRLKPALAAAISEGEGDKAVQLQEQLDQAVANANHFHGELETREREAEESRKKPDPAVNAGADEVAKAVQRNGSFFLSKHSWYDPNGGDADSRLTKKLDKAVFDDGFRPHQRAYWVELEKRMSAAGLIDDDDANERPQRQEDRGENRPRNSDGTFKSERGGPPVGGRTESTKKTVTIPLHLKEMMQEAGQWDDPVIRKRVVTAYYKNQEATKK